VSLYTSAHATLLQEIHKICRSRGFESRRFRQKQSESLLRLVQWLPEFLRQDVSGRLHELQEFFKLLTGTPSAFALRLAYLDGRVANQTQNPARDGVGLFWFSPILPLTPSDLQKAVALASAILPRFQQRALLTFINFDQKLVEATIPLYFDKEDAVSRERALNCWQALFEAFRQEGYAPYRYSVLHGAEGAYRSKHLRRLNGEVKKVFDPKGLVARGRYP
jgi:hypothetical protein